MISISAKVREQSSKGLKSLREQGILPGVLYGPKIENQSIEINLIKFKEVYKETGESSLISLKINDKEFLVLIHDIQEDPVSGQLVHVDFYQPILTEEVEVSVPIIFEGDALAVKDLGGTLVKEIQEIEVKALPQNLPHEIKVSVENLKTFEDEILVKDLKVPAEVKISREPDEIIAKVVSPTKVEEELEKPIEEETPEGAEEEGEEKEETEKKEEKTEDKEKKTEENKEEKANG